MIERTHLNLRNRLKRLNSKAFDYPKCPEMNDKVIESLLIANIIRFNLNLYIECMIKLRPSLLTLAVTHIR